jgi:hypothetical protein
MLGPLNTTNADKAAVQDIIRSDSQTLRKHLLLVSNGALVGQEQLLLSLPPHWIVQDLKGALRAREALLIGVRPEVMVVDFASEQEPMLALIERIKRSADPKINAIELVAYQCSDGSAKDRAMAFGVSAFIDTVEALLPFLGVEQNVPAVAEPTAPEPISTPSINSSVLAWVRDHSQRLSSPAAAAPSERRPETSAGLLLHGKLFFHQASRSQSENDKLVSGEYSVNDTPTSPARPKVTPPRPLRLALLKQQLRAGDDLMADDNGQFWLTLRTDNELKAIRVALRLAVALTRSSDPRHFVVGVALSGAYLGEDPSIAMQICQDTLPIIEPSGQLAVAVDRWKFSMPLLVAQALV